MEWQCLSLRKPCLPAVQSTVMARQHTCAGACQKLLSSPLFTRLSLASLLLPVGIEEEVENGGMVRLQSQLILSSV